MNYFVIVEAYSQLSNVYLLLIDGLVGYLKKLLFRFSIARESASHLHPVH